MQVFRFIRNLTATCAALLAVLVPAIRATAQTAPPEVKTVLLIHGAWADGSNWSKVIPILEAKGLHVVAVQIPLTSFADDVSATQRAIDLEDGPVLLVGHSYGRAVTTEVGNDPKVAGLVYMSAVAPDKGESAFGLITSVPTPIGTELRPDKSGFIKLTPKGIAEDFAQDLSPEEIAVLTASQVPTSVGAMKGRSLFQPGSQSRRGTSSPQITGRFLPIRGIAGEENRCDDNDSFLQLCSDAGLAITIR